MRFNIILFIILLASSDPSFGQEAYSISKAKFSSDKYDEFSPVFFRNGIVFCTNRDKNSMTDYSDAENKKQFDIFYIDTTGNVSWKKSSLFSSTFKSVLNDGPVTFDASGNIVYYSRNLKVDGSFKDLSSPRNKLGLFYSELVNNKWSKVKGFRYNNEFYNLGYNVTTPCLSPDGNRIFFASDMPGGYGGSDLYYCQKKDGDWDTPRNLGPLINTPGNESFPFITPIGELLFSSDGHPGLGGKDIFWSKQIDTLWSAPVHLEAPLNSPSNEFGIVTDSLIHTGYFSSDRDKTIDIYNFRVSIPQILYTEMQRTNHYCYSFSDTSRFASDSTLVSYKWNFGDGESKVGNKVVHCYKGSGLYIVKLDLIDRTNGKTFFTKSMYHLTLEGVDKKMINSPDVVKAGVETSFDAHGTVIPGFKLRDYIWDFGDGSRLKGENVTHIYSKPGDYIVRLGLVLKADTGKALQRTGVAKAIRVVDATATLNPGYTQNVSNDLAYPDFRSGAGSSLDLIFGSEYELQKDECYSVELISSRRKLSPNDPYFRRLPKYYNLEETLNPSDSTYSYTVENKFVLMETYPAYNELTRLGFTNARAKVVRVTDQAEKELFEVLRAYSNSVDFFFDSSERITPSAYVMIDRLIRLMKKYPAIRIGISVHSADNSQVMSNLAVTQRKAQLLSNYFVNRGISVSRIVATGYGGVKPVASANTESGRKQNKRVEFSLVK